jgi:hypothetical protein
VRWASDLGLDPSECVKQAEAAQHRYVRSRASDPEQTQLPSAFEQRRLPYSRQVHELVVLCVPKTSSTSRDLGVLVNDAAETITPPDLELI